MKSSSNIAVSVVGKMKEKRKDISVLEDSHAVVIGQTHPMAVDEQICGAI